MTSNWFGLYYPHVHFRDERWLKNTALYWDRMYRLSLMTEEEYADTLPNRSHVESILTGDFVADAGPSDDDRNVAAARFSEALQTMDLEPYQLGSDEFDRLAHLLSYRDPADPYTMRVEAFQEAARAQLTPLMDYVANWKIDLSLLERLVDMRLAVPDHFGTGPRLWMHETLAHAYLLVLGMRMAERYGARPVADEETHHAATGQAAQRLIATCLPSGVNGLPLQAGENEGLLINLAVETVLPRHIDLVSAERIINFRGRYAGERARFRQKVSQMLQEATELDAISDRNVLRDHLQARFDAELRPALRDLDAALRGQGIETALGAVDIQVAVPAAAATGLAALAVHPAAPVAAAIGATGFALGIWKSAIKHRRDANKTLTESPVAYLHHLKTDLAPHELSERVRAIAGRIAPPLRDSCGP